MRKIASTVHFGLGVVILIGIIVEFYFAGMGVFSAISFMIHRTAGVILLAGSLLLVLSAFLGKIGAKSIGYTILLFLLLFIQPLLLQIHQPFLKALHLINGLAITAVAAYLVIIGTKTLKGRK